MVDWNVHQVRFKTSNCVMDQSSLKFFFRSVNGSDKLILKSIPESFVLDETESKDAIHQKNWMIYEKVKQRFIL